MSLLPSFDQWCIDEAVKEKWKGPSSSIGAEASGPQTRIFGFNCTRAKSHRNAQFVQKIGEPLSDIRLRLIAVIE